MTVKTEKELESGRRGTGLFLFDVTVGKAGAGLFGLGLKAAVVLMRNDYKEHIVSILVFVLSC